MCRFEVQYIETKSGRLHSIAATFLMVTTGILGEQFSLDERNIRNSGAFKGSITLAGRHNQHDCPIGSEDAHGKVSTYCDLLPEKCGHALVNSKTIPLLLSHAGECLAPICGEGPLEVPMVLAAASPGLRKKCCVCDCCTVHGDTIRVLRVLVYFLPTGGCYPRVWGICMRGYGSSTSQWC